MGSLLQRASLKRTAAQRLQGVSAADQEDIRREIARISEKNRLEVTPELLSVRQGRAGLLFPVIVNVVAIAALLIGVLSFSTLFRRADNAAPTSRFAALASAEGAVLSQLQQQVQQELAQRDAEIDAIRRQLEAVQRERADIDADIVRRESEQKAVLEQNLATDLQIERTRLEALGLGLDEIETRLAQYEADRRAEIDRELASYVAGLQRERDQLVDELAGLQSSLQGDLESLTHDRDRIERDLQAAMQTADAELEAALTEMELLESIARRREQVDAQVVGSFSALRNAMNAGQLDLARAEISALRNLLNQPQVRDTRGEDRWQIDMFIVDRLETVLAVIDETDEDVTDEVDAIDRLTARIVELASFGDAALAVNNLQQAEAYFTEAISIIPQLLDGHRFLLDRAVQARLDTQQQELQAAAEAGIRTVQDELALARDRLTEQEQESSQLRAELEQARLAATIPAPAPSPVASTPASAISADEVVRLRRAAERLEIIEARYETFRRETPVAVDTAPTNLLSARRMLDDVLSSAEFDDTLPGVAEDLARIQDAHFEAGREDAFSETVDVLYGVAALVSNRDRADYLNRVLNSGNHHPMFRDLLEQLRTLVQDTLTAQR